MDTVLQWSKSQSMSISLSEMDKAISCLDLYQLSTRAERGENSLFILELSIQEDY